MSLPEIPTEVLLAIQLGTPWLSEHDSNAAAHAAWPALYATALRHAADALNADYVNNINDVAMSDNAEQHLNTLRRMNLRDIRTLRALADAAVQS